ncbi:coiled-coil domain-containing protein 169-like [Centruroides sculpturatus]|uniref:coiled-coil domain-containing protein 169-like n=1 Tax=Centruroides sculpturatus TaxID=218467 RepID=UPI000C6D24C5|nr:coiled-coil domain-containing protein 169-like [Centruroides sculpturatus]
MYSRRQGNRNRMLYKEAEKDLADLRAEVETEEQMKEMLDISIAELQETLLTLEQDLENADIGEEDEWKVRYYTQMEVNNQLQQQKDWLKSKVETSRNQSHEGVTALLADLDLDSLSENQLLRYLRQLEKDRNALYNELRDTEWKLDKESKTFHKYNDTRNAYMTEITEVMMNLEAMRNRLKSVESAETGSLQKCPRHLKYLNILPDQRVIDPKKGPIKKIATVRSLPKLDSTPDEDFEEAEEEVGEEENNEPEA